MYDLMLNSCQQIIARELAPAGPTSKCALTAAFQSSDILGRAGDLLVRRLRDDPHDYRLMARWLTDERVIQFYHGRDNPYPYQRVVQKYGPRARGEDPESVVACIIELAGRAIGYIQYCPAVAEAYELEDAADTYAIDMFIGEPELWGTGVGSAALSALVYYIFEELGARRVVIDPHVDNQRAVRAYQKCGFRKVKLLPAHELHEGVWRDCWLMAIERPQASRQI